jgi:hypothetical protein
MLFIQRFRQEVTSYIIAIRTRSVQNDLGDREPQIILKFSKCKSMKSFPLWVRTRF